MQHSKSSKYNSRPKPELLLPDPYSLVHYRKAETVVSDYNKLAEEAEKIYLALPNQYKDAYYQLVLYPVQASANSNALHVTVGQNRLYAQQGHASTNELRVPVLYSLAIPNFPNFTIKPWWAAND